MASEGRPLTFAALPSGPGVPSRLAAELEDPGVPREFFNGLFRAVGQAVPGPGSRTDLVIIGVFREPAFYCVDIATTAVLVSDGISDSPLVNATLRQFRECVHAVDAMWRPSEWTELEDHERAAEQFREALLAIDRTTFESDDVSLWETVYYDIQMGSYF